MSYTKDSPILKNNDLQWEYGCGANGMNPDQLAIATGAWIWNDTRTGYKPIGSNISQANECNEAFGSKKWTDQM